MTIDVIELLQKQIKTLQGSDKLTLEEDIMEYLTAFDNVLEHVDNIDVANGNH